MCIVDPLKGTKLELRIISNTSPSGRLKDIWTRLGYWALIN